MTDSAPEPAWVHLSVSTWQQPIPPTASAARTGVIARIADRVLALGHSRLRVGIDGLTAAGKTSLGHELARDIAAAGRPVLRASLDDFKKPWRDRHLYDRESGEGYYRNAFDYAAVTRLLLALAGPEGNGECALCSIDPLTQTDHSGAITHAPHDAVLIVDGVFAFRPEINDYWDLRVWVEVTDEVSVQRGSVRDRDWAGSEAEAIHRTRYLMAERLYVAEVDPLRLADVVVNNTDFERPRILRWSADGLAGPSR
jgi:uridine kinase